jgi:hypothetical protein
MAVHLNHPAGAWFKMTQSWIERNKASIVVYDHLYTHLEAKYRPIIARVLHELCLKIAREYENMGELTSARSYAVKSFTKHFLVSRKLFKILLRLYVPILYKLLRSLKRATYFIIKKIYGILARFSGKIQTSLDIQR